jgi:hypothetical protein
MRFISPLFFSLFLTACLSVGRSDGARTLAPGKFELGVQVGVQNQDYQEPNATCGTEGTLACGAQDPTRDSAKEQENERKNDYAFSTGILTLQGQGRIGIVDSLDVGVFVSFLTGIGLDLKKNWIDSESFAVATSVTGMTNFSSSVRSLGDSRMSSVHLSLPMEANVKVANLNSKGVVVVAPLIGYYRKTFTTSRQSQREDRVTGAQAMVGLDSDAVACQCTLRFGINGWYLQPRQIGLATLGAALGMGLSLR